MVNFAAGIDIGATSTRVGLVDNDGTVVSAVTMDTDTTANPEIFARTLSSALTDLCRDTGDCGVSRVGVGVAGLVERATGRVVSAHNLGWREFPLRDVISALTAKPVFVSNDVACIAYGEWKHGTGVGFDDVLCVFVGTGIGGAIVSNGTLVEGSSGLAGEVGHTVIRSGGRECTCGGRGCLEAYAGGWAIAQIAGERLTPESGKLTAKMVIEAAAAGDEPCRGVVRDSVNALVLGLSGLVNTLDPAVIILGGGVIVGYADSGIDIAGRLSAGIHEHSSVAAVSAPLITLSALGDMAGVIGAATLARERA